MVHEFGYSNCFSRACGVVYIISVLLVIMRKMVVRMNIDTLNPVIRKYQSNMLDIIEEYELLELVRTDFEKGLKIHLSKITVRKGRRYEEIKWPKTFDVMLLKENGREYIVLISSKVPDSAFRRLFDRFKIDIIVTHPTYFKDGVMTFSMMGGPGDLKKALRAMKFVGKVHEVSFHKAVFEEHSALSLLTEKQKEIVIEAMKNGYYDYPRKIDAGGVAEKVGVTKATALEHLRKAEGRLMKSLLIGY
jgi:predicted DNA binding protein